jgi:hypothetical protein
VPEGRNLASGRQYQVWVPDPENLGFFVFRAGKGPTPQRANLLALTTCRSDADGQADHRKLATKAPQNLDVKLKK